MKKIVFLALAALLPMTCLFSDVEIKGKKWDLINRAKQERKTAIGQLEFAENIAWYIPDLGDQQHFRALIGSAIVTLPVATAKAKILGTGLALIASIADKAFDRYVEMRDCLIAANYHFEMAKFYDQISLTVSDAPTGKNGMDTGEDQATKDYFRSVDSIIMASMFAQCIDNKRSRMTVCNALDEHLECLKARGSNMVDESESLVESIGEILADFCDDNDLFNEIENYVCLSHEYIIEAQTAWNKKTIAKRR